MIGMTKEHFILSLGYPRMDKTPCLSKREWTYWTDKSEEYLVIWDEDNSVRKITAKPTVRALVEFSQHPR